MKTIRSLLLLLLTVSLLLSLVSCGEPIDRIERILTEEGFTVVRTEEKLHADLEARLEATRPGEWLDVYVFKEDKKDVAETMYQSMLKNYEKLPNMIAVLDGTTLIHGHRTVYLLLE